MRCCNHVLGPVFLDVARHWCRLSKLMLLWHVLNKYVMKQSLA